MATRSREKIAVIVLALLVVLLGACSCAYMGTGKQWTAAAAHVDDSVGSMAGYTVILYEGTNEADSDDIEAEAGASKAIDPLYVSDVRSAYVSKQASVISLDANNLIRYAEPTLYVSNGKRIVVFSLDEDQTEARFNVLNGLVSSMRPDLVLCLAPSLDALPSLAGVDIVLLTSSAGGFTTLGTSEGGAYVLSTPETGAVGVIMITPSNVVSSKVVDML